MKVLMINGSRREHGCTYTALQKMAEVFAEAGVESEIIFVGKRAVNGEIDELVKEIAGAAATADGIVVGSPVYYASANATLIACLDRLFFSTHFDKTMKVGASIVVARRGGCSSTFDELNKYFTITGMPIASSRYWNSVHGRESGEAAYDAEGLMNMRTLARNMTFLMKSIALGKEKYGLPEGEPWQPTNFIRDDLID